jgi:hypothetical protein
MVMKQINKTMDRTLCAMELVERLEMAENAQYYCKKCGEKAQKEDNLCSPEEIKDRKTQ